MGELSDRRARKKAQTREQIRRVAHGLFADQGFDAVTIADIAREADVAVQTVFNHFATKEELFFDGRTPWVDGPAEAVRNREPGVAPLRALRMYLVDLVGALVGSLHVGERRSYITTIERSEGLCTRERELVFAAERQLAAALQEAWTEQDEDVDAVTHPTPGDPGTMARLTAATWMAVARALIMDNRAQVTEGADTAQTAAATAALVDRLLGQLERHLGEEVRALPSEALPRTGWPQQNVRRAG